MKDHRLGSQDVLKLEDAQDERQENASEGRTTDVLVRARKRGGQMCLEKYGVEHYQRIGKKGGIATKQRHDAAYYRRIGALGGAAKSKKKRERQVPAFPAPVPVAEEEGRK